MSPGTLQGPSLPNVRLILVPHMLVTREGQGMKLIPYHMIYASTVQAHRGITKALLVSGDLVTSSAAELDQLGVLANLQALISLATDVSKYNAAT